jgi:hypothetical protein
MDGSHVQPVVGLLEGFTGVRQLLRRTLGEENGTSGVGKRCGSSIFLRFTLERTLGLERRGEHRSEKKKGFLREHGRRVRTSERIESPKNTTLEFNRSDAVAGLAAPDKAPSKHPPDGSLEKGLACKRLVRHDSGKPAFRRETASIFAAEWRRSAVSFM